MDRQLIIFTDLDGTLLDHATYSPSAAQETLAAAQEAGVPVIFCSSKTRAEIEVWRAQLGSRDPFIVENGGAIFIPSGYFPFEVEGAQARDDYQVLELGAPYERVVSALRALREELAVEIVGFSDLTQAELAAKAHLTLVEASRAQMREYDEPFMLLREDEAALAAIGEAVARRGLRVTRGGRFHHLQGQSDKGAAVVKLIALYRRQYGEVLTAALGDSGNDLEMLAAVDRPLLVAKPGGEHDAEVLGMLPRVEAVEGIGPAGWAQGVRELLAEAGAEMSV